MSMWAHARHVLHFTADPSAAPRRKLRIPRPHFRLPRFSLGWKRSTGAPEATPDLAAEKPARRRKPRKVTPKQVETTDDVPAAEEPVAPQPAPSRRTFRVDARHAPTAAPEPEPQAEPQEEWVEPVPPESHSRDEASHRAFEEHQEERPVAAIEDRAESQSENYDDEDQDFGNQPKPDLRGMSKKQRRKILAELRDKERGNRRG